MRVTIAWGDGPVFEVDCEVSLIATSPRGPSYSSGGEPGSGDEVDFLAVRRVDMRPSRDPACLSIMHGTPGGGCRCEVPVPVRVGEFLRVVGAPAARDIEARAVSEARDMVAYRGEARGW